MKPFIKYPGGKTKEIPLVRKFMPKKVERYFEPFVGGGSIYFDLEIEQSFINDKSRDLYLLYKLIKEQDLSLKKILYDMDIFWKKLDNDVKFDYKKDTLSFKFDKYYASALKRKQNSIIKFESQGLNVSDEDKELLYRTARKTAFYMIIRDIYNSKQENVSLHVASFYFLREYCYSSMFRFSKTGNFNVPYGGRSYDLKYMSTKLDYMFSKEVEDYFKHTEISNDDFEIFLKKYSLASSDFIFLDPPYDSDFSTYDQNTFDKNEQIRLRDNLKNTKAKWMLIIKKTDFIYDLYKEFNILEYDMNYMVSFKNRNDRDVKHLLITNYEIEEKI